MQNGLANELTMVSGLAISNYSALVILILAWPELAAKYDHKRFTIVTSYEFIVVILTK